MPEHAKHLHFYRANYPRKRKTQVVDMRIINRLAFVSHVKKCSHLTPGYLGYDLGGCRGAPRNIYSSSINIYKNIKLKHLGNIVAFLRL